METGTGPSTVVLFGPFEVNATAGELRKHGVRVQLARQPFQVLTALLDRPGEVLSRDDLRQQLWADNTFVDFEKGLNAAMNKLRQALGDSAEKPRYIETLPGRGYRLIAAVQRTEAKLALIATAAPQPLETVVSPRRHLWTALVALAGLAIVIAGFIWLRPTPPEPSQVASRFTIDPPAGHILEPAGSRQAFAVSPDGSRLAIIALNPEGLFGVWIRDLASLQPRYLQNTDGANNVFWSNDSRSLFFTIYGSVRRTGPDGGSYQVVTELSYPAYQVASLSKDTLLISSRGRTYTVGEKGGTAHELSERYTWPQVLPGGERILYISFDPKTQRNRVRVAKLNQQNSAIDLLESDSRVLFARSNTRTGKGHLLYVRAGNLLAQPFDVHSLRVSGDARPLAAGVSSFLPTGAADFTVSDNGMLVFQTFVPRSRLVWLDRQGREVGSIGPPNLAVKYARLSPDGRKVAAPLYDVGKGVTEIWIFDVSTGAGRRIVSGPPLMDAPVWSPDSARIIYGRANGGPPKLFSRGIGDKDREEPLAEDVFQLPSDWSRDGRFVAYSNTVAPGRVSTEREGDVSVADVKARKIVPLLNTPSHETSAMFSPDGKWLAFVSNDSGRQEVYLQRFEAGDSPRTSGERHLASRDGALSVRWGPNGKEIFYLGMDSRLYAVPVTLSPSLQIGKPQALFTITTQSRAVLPTSFGFDVSADGQRFLVATAPVDHTTSLVAIQNWELLLR